MELNEKLRLCAEYDGWTLFKKHWIAPIDFDLSLTDFNELKYNTSFDWLIPVCRKVVADLKALNGGANSLTKYKANEIKFIAGTFDIAALFDSVCAAINLLNQHKNEKV